MHMVNPDTHWSYPSVGSAEDKEEESSESLDDEKALDELEKTALGLMDIPGSIDGGEVLEWQGIPQNPGLSREQGEDEETDYFGAESEILEEVPPVNKRYETYEYLEDLVEEEELNFFDFLEDTVKTTRSYLAHVDDLYRALLKIGKAEDALVLHHVLKRSGNLNSESVDDKIERYIHSKKTLLNKAAREGIRIDYEPKSWSDGVYFYFKGAHNNGGEWFYDHGTVKSKCAVSDIVSGEKDPSWLGLEPYQLEAIAELDRMEDDLLGGLVFLHSLAKKNDAFVDWVDAPVALYYDALTDLTSSLKSVTKGALDERTVQGSNSLNRALGEKMQKYLDELKLDLERLERTKEASAVDLLIKTSQRGPGPYGGGPPGMGSPVNWGGSSRKSEPTVKSRISVEPGDTPPGQGTSDPSKDEHGRSYESFSSVDDMVSAGLLSSEDAQYLRERSATQSFDSSYFVNELGMDRHYAEQLSNLLMEEAQRRPAPAAKIKPSKYRFPYSEELKAVQRGIGADDDGWWGSKTDAAWNAKMDEIGPQAEPYKVGGEKFPTDISQATEVLGGVPFQNAQEKAPEGETANPEAAVAPEAAIEAKTPEEATPEARSAIEKIELSLTDPRKGQPKMMSFIAGNDSRRGVALIEWPEETDAAQKYDTIIQLDDGTWELGAATRREMRALRRPQVKDVRKEMRRERKEMPRSERRELRREERRRRREAALEELNELTKKTASERMKERAKKFLS